MPAFVGAIVERLGVRPDLRLDTSVPGVVATTTVPPDGDRMLHLVNPTGYEARVEVSWGGTPLGDGAPFSAPPRAGFMLALGVSVPWGRIVSANAEIRSLGGGGLAIGPGLGARTHVTLETDRRVTCAEGSPIEVRRGLVVVTGDGGGPLTLRLS